MFQTSIRLFMRTLCLTRSIIQVPPPIQYHWMGKEQNVKKMERKEGKAYKDVLGVGNGGYDSGSEH